MKPKKYTLHSQGLLNSLDQLLTTSSAAWLLGQFLSPSLGTTVKPKSCTDAAVSAPIPGVPVDSVTAPCLQAALSLGFHSQVGNVYLLWGSIQRTCYVGYFKEASKSVQVLLNGV